MKISQCPICGYHIGVTVEIEELRKSYWICECCGCEYGLDDTPYYREQWIAKGAKWFTPSARPGDWDLQEQLQKCDYSWNAE